MIYEKRIYEPLRNDLDFKWYQNTLHYLDKLFTIIAGSIFFVFAIIFTILMYPNLGFIIFFITVFSLIILIIVLKHNYDVPLKVGLFSHGVVFDYNGKYEYLYWFDVEFIKDSASPKMPTYRYLTIKKKNGLLKSLGNLDKNINALIKIKINEYSDPTTPTSLMPPSR